MGENKTAKNELRKNGSFSFSADNEVHIKEKYGDMTREPWLMLLIRRNQTPTRTLCWGITNNGTTFARIGTQEGDILNGFVHEDPYKTRMLGSYVYIVDEDGKYFTNTWYPTLHKDQELETTFGFGYVKFDTSYNDFDVNTTCFVPNQFDGMLQIVKIKNNSSKARKIKLFNVNPINIGDARDIQFAGFNSLMLGGGKVEKDINSIVWRRGYGVPFADDKDTIMSMFGKVAVHTSSLPNNQFATKYDAFVGHHSNTMGNPAALNEDFLEGKDAEELTSALSTLKNELTIGPGEEKEVVFALLCSSTEDYYTKGGKELKETLAVVNDPAKVKALFEEVKAEWKEELDKLQINVPVENELMPSFRWLQYQCEMVVNLNRMKSRYHSGFEYGYGFRDILQDLLAILPYGTERVKDLIKYTSEQMFSDGSVYHNFFVSAPGNKDFVACDDPLWLVYAVCEYIKESGDFSILDDVVDFADAKEGMPAASGTILDHCVTGIERVWTNSDKGLPFMLDADWNDDLSALNDHMSIMAAQMLYKAFNDMITLFNVKGIKADLVKTYTERAAVVKESVESRGIDVDGSYIRALSPEPGKIPHLGAKEEDGFTFFEPIAWAGFSGIASAEQFEKAMAVCESDLYDQYGITICQGDKVMAGGKLPEDHSAWKRNAPGKKENGGEFRHLESWYIASLCKYGYGKKAHDLYIKTLPPVASSHDPYNYAVERFVFPEYCSGPASNEHGRAGHTWLTGTAPTRLGVLMDWVFGVRRDYDGLLLDPCVDPSWKEFSAHRYYRGTHFDINFTNPDGVEKGVKQVSVDGTVIEGATIPASYYDGKNHVVDVVMGR